MGPLFNKMIEMIQISCPSFLVELASSDFLFILKAGSPQNTMQCEFVLVLGFFGQDEF